MLHEPSLLRAWPAAYPYPTLTGLPRAQIVPTIYQDMRNRTIQTNQYSVTEHFKPSDMPGGHQLPGVFFFYDLSPIKGRNPILS